MSRRVHTATVRCTYPNCKATGHREYSSLREYHADTDDREKWRCVRHTEPNEVLSSEHRTRTVEMTSQTVSGCGATLFWKATDQRASSGFEYGPGFKAYAEDFPAGTRLIVTATILLPED